MSTPVNQKEVLKNILQALKQSGKVKSRKAFLKPAGITAESYGTQIFKEGNAVSFPPDRVELLLTAWNINPEYWYHQKGEMFLTNGNNTSNNSSIAVGDRLIAPGGGTRQESNLKHIERNIIPIPIVEKRAQAGYPLGHFDPEYVESLPKIYVSKEFEKGNYVAFEVKDDSMDIDSRKAICEGDVVMAKDVDRDLWRDKLNFGKYLFVVAFDERCEIRQITNHDTQTGEITCHSFNPFYEDFTIRLDEVSQLLYVVKIVDKAIRL